MTNPSGSAKIDSDCSSMPRAWYERLCEALEHAATLDEALTQIDAARDAMLGRGLLTVNLNVTGPGELLDEVQLQRIWSSEPEAYPVSGRKQKNFTPWTLKLFSQAEIFIGEGDLVLAEVFDDHAQLKALGLHAVVNVPMVRDGRCFATFNVLCNRARWQSGEIAVIRTLARLAEPWVFRSDVDSIGRQSKVSTTVPKNRERF